MPFVTFIPCPPHIRSPSHQDKRHNFHKEPTPPTSLSPPPLHTRTGLLLPLTRVHFHLRRFPNLFIKIIGFHRDDVEVVGELACCGAEAKVGDGWDGDGAGFEAEGPFVSGFVLEFEFEGLVLEVSEAGFGGDAGAADAPGLVGNVAVR